MSATTKMIFAISTEMIATPPKPRTPAINATMRKAIAQPNMGKPSAFTVYRPLVRKSCRMGFVPVPWSHVRECSLGHEFARSCGRRTATQWLRSWLGSLRGGRGRAFSLCGLRPCVIPRSQGVWGVLEGYPNLHRKASPAASASRPACDSYFGSVNPPTSPHSLAYGRHRLHERRNRADAEVMRG